MLRTIPLASVVFLPVTTATSHMRDAELYLHSSIEGEGHESSTQSTQFQIPADAATAAYDDELDLLEQEHDDVHVDHHVHDNESFTQVVEEEENKQLVTTGGTTVTFNPFPSSGVWCADLWKRQFTDANFNIGGMKEKREKARGGGGVWNDGRRSSC